MKKKQFTALLSVLLCLTLLTACGGSAKEGAAYGTTADMAYAEEAYYSYAESPAEAPAALYSGNGGISNSKASSAGNSSGKLQSEKIIYSASAEVETTEYDQTIEAVNAMVERYGGFVESSSVSGANYYRTSRGLTSLRSASFTLRIPCEHFAELTGSLSELGNVPYCNTSSQNVTASYYDVEARKTAYEAQEARLLEMLAVAETVEDMLAIQQQLSDVQYEIDSLQSRLTNYDRQVSYSTVNLTVSEVEVYTETPAVTLSYTEKLQQSFTQSCKNVAEFFTDGSLWLIGNLPEILLWAVMIFLVLRFLRFLFRKRQNRERTERKSWKQRRAEKKAAKEAVPTPSEEKND